MFTVLVITLGGTIASRMPDTGGMMTRDLAPIDQIRDVELQGIEWRVQEFRRTASVNLSLTDVADVRDAIIKSTDIADGVVVTTGTDAMEEFADALDLLLPSRTPPVAVTGAMRPPDMAGSDAAWNVRDASAVVSSTAFDDENVMVVMNGAVHAARFVRKHDSTALAAFDLDGAELGAVRGGNPRRWCATSSPRGDFAHLRRDDIPNATVPIVVPAAATDLPNSLLSNVDGLVVAGMGAGGLPTRLFDRLTAEWCDRMPIALVSRCSRGPNGDPETYPGSVERRRAAGFLVDDFEYLDPIRARTRLVLGHIAQRAPRA